jgi:HAD superfamily hydrolase (TIGR01549 family)
LSKLDLGKFEAVIFDLDSTLTNTHRYPFAAIQWLLDESGIYSEEVRNSFILNIFNRYTAAIREIVEGAPFRAAYEIVQTAIGKSLVDIEQRVDTTLIQEATDRFKALHIEFSTPYDGVYDILETLKTRKVKLGVISNSFAGHSRIILNKLKMAHFFSSIVDCGDVNAFKPMKAPFERVLHELGVQSAEAIYVGDEYYADIVGAKAVGLTTVWINLRGRSIEDQVKKYGADTIPDVIFESIADFAELF